MVRQVLLQSWLEPGQGGDLGRTTLRYLICTLLIATGCAKLALDCGLPSSELPADPNSSCTASIKQTRSGETTVTAATTTTRDVAKTRITYSSGAIQTKTQPVLVPGG